jgi:CRP-like cAMP-binding protein
MGEVGHFFYIVKEGAFELLLESDEQVKYYTVGQSFGELALIQKNKRSGTIKCLEDAELYGLEGDIFRSIIVNANKINLTDRLYFLSLISIFSNLIIILGSLNQTQIYNIACHMVGCEFLQSHIIIKGKVMLNFRK